MSTDSIWTWIWSYVQVLRPLLPLPLQLWHASKTLALHRSLCSARNMFCTRTTFSSSIPSNHPQLSPLPAHNPEPREQRPSSMGTPHMNPRWLLTTYNTARQDAQRTTFTLTNPLCSRRRAFTDMNRMIPTWGDGSKLALSWPSYSTISVLRIIFSGPIEENSWTWNLTDLGNGKR